MNPPLATALLCLAVLTPNAALPAEDLLLADFEGTDYGAWRTTGEAFGPGPARGTLPGQMQVDGFKGLGLVNSFHNGDGTTGTLTSPEFKLERRFISFLIGDGRNVGTTCMNLLVDGRVVRNATGPNDKPGGAEALAPESWDVSEFAGKAAVIQIVDQATGGWGHINIDHIVQTDRKPPGLVANARRQFRIGQRCGWFQTPTPGMPFNQSMTLPLELKLVGTSEGPRLTWTPVKELASLRTRQHVVTPMTLEPDAPNPLADVKAELVELRAEFEPGEAGEVIFTVRGATILYDAKTQELGVNGHRAPAPLREGRQRLVIYCDRTGLEVFASDGLTYVPMPFVAAADNLGLGVHVQGGSARVTSLQVHELRSAWGPK